MPDESSPLARARSISPRQPDLGDPEVRARIVDAAVRRGRWAQLRFFVLGGIAGALGLGLVVMALLGGVFAILSAVIGWFSA